MPRFYKNICITSLYKKGKSVQLQTHKCMFRKVAVGHVKVTSSMALALEGISLMH